MCGGKASPNPDYPQDIHVVTGDNTLYKIGKNLLGLANQTVSKSGVTITIENGKATFSGTFTGSPTSIDVTIPNIVLDSTKKYSISMNDNKTAPAGFGRYLLDSGNNLIRWSYGQSGLRNENNVSPNSNTTALKFQFAFNSQNTNYDGFTCQVQIEENNVATNFEPYTSQTQLISLGSIELARIPDTDIKDVMFKAVSSNNPLKPSYYDTLPSEVKASLTSGSWYKQNTFVDIDVTGTESVSRETTTNNNYRFNIGVSVQLKTGGSSYTANLLCNRLVVKTGTEQFLEQQGIRPFKYNTSYFLQVYTDETKQYTNDQFKTWLASHNLKVIVELATPTYTPITDTTLIAQLENVLKMHTNKNVTNASIEPSGTNAQAGLTLTYRQDLQTLTDKISNLEARVSLLE